MTTANIQEWFVQIAKLSVVELWDVKMVEYQFSSKGRFRVRLRPSHVGWDITDIVTGHTLEVKSYKAREEFRIYIKHYEAAMSEEFYRLHTHD